MEMLVSYPASNYSTIIANLQVCGAGGMTRGAVTAGLKVNWGFDFNPNAGETWRTNFPNSKFFQMWANEFATLHDPDHDLSVDILHLSPPCQVFSPIKVRPGQDDEMNFASLFAVRELIEKTKPRMVTLEQTFGILHNKYRPAFNALIGMFTDHGFSVRWQVVKFQDWGLAQSRKRLVILAAW
jgi:DNA (cytosine-5)-methyltransferase 1